MIANLVGFVRKEIERQLNVILSGQAGANTSTENETIDNLYPGMPSIESRPVMHPYGFVSRAPRKTISVTGKQGAGPQNRMTLGHRDSLDRRLDATRATPRSTAPTARRCSHS